MIDARLPAHYERAAVEAERDAPWLMATLLEAGDARDLRWLARRFGEKRLSAWVAERGARQLSARSFAFWRLVLAVDEVVEPSTKTREALWPR